MIQCIFLLISVEKVFQIKEDTESMKKKIVSLKAELRKEMKIHDDKGEVCFFGGWGFYLSSHAYILLIDWFINGSILQINKG